PTITGLRRKSSGDYHVTFCAVCKNDQVLSAETKDPLHLYQVRCTGGCTKGDAVYMHQPCFSKLQKLLNKGESKDGDEILPGADEISRITKAVCPICQNTTIGHPFCVACGAAQLDSNGNEVPVAQFKSEDPFAFDNCHALCAPGESPLTCQHCKAQNWLVGLV